jgi:hypothetical protein
MHIDQADGLAEYFHRGYAGTIEPNEEYCPEPEEDPPAAYVQGARAYLKAKATGPISRFEIAAALVRNFGLTDATALKLWEQSGARTEPDHSDRSLEDMLSGARERGKGSYGAGPASPGGAYVKISAIPDWQKIALAALHPREMRRMTIRRLVDQTRRMKSS